MGLNPDAAGKSLGVTSFAWNDRDVMLYAVGVGAGVDQLSLTTENSAGVELQVLPTFATVIVAPDLTSPVLGDYEWSSLVHGQQRVVQHRPLPVEGAATVTATVLAMDDKGPGRPGIVVIGYEATDFRSGELLVTCEVTAVIRGAGGFGGERGAAATPFAVPSRKPDCAVAERIPLDQALLYRLSGDRNPLHSDPAFAAKAGWERPILHGLCTYGYAGRALVETVCGGDPARFGSMDARFVAPVFPGEELTTSVWFTEGGAVFRAFAGDGGRVVLDDGIFEIANDSDAEATWTR